MSEMIKRVAKALAKQEGYAYDEFPYDARARAAIEAMRDLTDDMDMAGTESLPAPDGHSMPDDFRDAWRSAIDAALKAE